MANLTSTTITGTLNTTSTITGPASGASALNASNVSSGTLSTDRLPTVPTTKGGTGLTSIGSAGQVLTVSAPGSALEFADAGGGGNYIRRIYTGPATWTYDASIQAIKVTVVGGGGTGGTCNGNPGNGGNGGSGGYSDEYLSAPALSAPVSVTVGGAGGTSSFGAFLSATGGNGGGTVNSGKGSHGSPGSGSGGNINEFANPVYSLDYSIFYSPYSTPGNGIVFRGWGSLGRYTNSVDLGNPGEGYGGGGRGGSNRNIPAFPGAGGTGAPGIVVVEEFY